MQWSGSSWFSRLSLRCWQLDWVVIRSASSDFVIADQTKLTTQQQTACKWFPNVSLHLCSDKPRQMSYRHRTKYMPHVCEWHALRWAGTASTQFVTYCCGIRNNGSNLTHPKHPKHQSPASSKMKTLPSFLCLFFRWKTRTLQGAKWERGGEGEEQGGASGITFTRLPYHCFLSDPCLTHTHTLLWHISYHLLCSLCFSPAALSDDISAGAGLEVDPIWCLCIRVCVRVCVISGAMLAGTLAIWGRGFAGCWLPLMCYVSPPTYRWLARLCKCKLLSQIFDISLKKFELKFLPSALKRFLQIIFFAKVCVLVNVFTFCHAASTNSMCFI